MLLGGGFNSSITLFRNNTLFNKFISSHDKPDCRGILAENHCCAGTKLGPQIQDKRFVLAAGSSRLGL